MLDLLTLLFYALKYSIRAIARPSADPAIRRYEIGLIIFAVAGAVFLAWTVVHIAVFGMGSVWWVLLLTLTGGMWCVAACIGDMIEKLDKARNGEGPPES